MTFDDWTTIACRTGQLDLIGGALTIQACLVEDVEDLLGTGMDRDGCDRLGNAHREDAAGVQCLPQGLLIEAEVPRHRMDAEAVWWRDVGNRLLDFVQQGQDITGIAWIPFRDAIRKDKARGRVGRDPRLTPKLHGAIALAFEDGRDRQIVGIDEFTVRQCLAMDEPGGLLADVGMVIQGRAERLGETLALPIAQRCRLDQEALGLLPQSGDGLPQLQQFLFCVAHQLHKDLTLPTTLATKAPHDLGQLLLECLGLTPEGRGAAAARLREVFDERQRFFALYTGSWHR